METKKKKRRYKNTKADWLCIILLCAPAIIHLLLFWLGVQIESIQMAFTDVTTGEFSLKNFVWAFKSLFDSGDSELPGYFRNTCIYFGLAIVRMPITMFFAYLIFRKCIGHAFSRVALYLPASICGTLIALVYIKIMESEGPVVQLIQTLRHSDEPIYFMVQNGLLFVLLFDLLIGVGGNLILWLGTMSRIPMGLIESGKLEGITPFQEFKHVVLPLVWPTFVTMITLQVVGFFGSSGSVLILTDGKFNTASLSFWMYRVVQTSSVTEYNMVSALGLILTIFTVPLLLITRWFGNRYGEEVEY